MCVGFRPRSFRGVLMSDSTPSHDTKERHSLRGRQCERFYSMSKRSRSGETPLPKRIKMNNVGASNGSFGGDKMEIDEDLHSRQLAVYGRDSMRKMAAASVLIVGAGGLGVEVAKNVILAGVKAVTLHDAVTVQLSDLSAQFYLSKQDVGANRAEACIERLQELNPAVSVSAATAELNDDFLGGFTVVVVTEGSLSDAEKINAICRSREYPTAFIKAETRGLFANVFCDFGPSFHVVDVDGEQPFTGIVAAVTPSSSTTLVSCIEDERLHFQDGMLVTFSEVEGMTELNTQGPFRVTDCQKNSFKLEVDSTQFGNYSRGGLVTQKKEGKDLSFKSLSQAIAEPGEFLISDFAKLDRSPLLHVAFQALDVFRVANGRFPAPGNAGDADDFIAIAKEVNAEMSEKATLDETLLRHFASGSSADLNPMAAMFGGVVGQEVVKAASGKFHPLFQWFYFDCAEALPSDPLPVEEVQPIGCRYDHQIAVFGKTMQHKLADLKLFLVGAGALGCEFLKNFAMMGVGCGADGVCIVTDDDQIEKSNLSRQFLFRDWDIRSMKSTVAAKAATVINPEFKVNPLQERVSPKTEDTFDDTFWEGLDVVVNALDNVQARLYVDSKCVYYCKPLLESGTLGAKCNTQMVIPHMTENYGASRDPPETQAPMCTVHSFPHNIDHCLAWGRSEFEGMLENKPSEVNKYLKDPEAAKASIRSSLDAQNRAKLEGVAEALTMDFCKTFEDCIKSARLKFEDYFHNKIAQLVYTFPEDSTTSNQTLFWSAPKRFPHVLNLDADDAGHASLIQGLSILLAEVYGVPRPEWAGDMFKVAEVAASFHLPKFLPKDGVHIETDPSKTENDTRMAIDGIVDEAAIIEDLFTKVDGAIASLPSGFKLTPIEFEKDDDTNYHMDVITGLSNMRARNYHIEEVDKLKAKFVAGRIIPAIATATAMATGLVCLELYKVIQGKEVEAYRNTFANLALPLFAMAEPIPPKREKFRDMEWSLWNRWVLEGDLTVEEALKHFREKGLEVYSISFGASLLYNNIFGNHKQRMGKKLSDLVQTVGKCQIPDSKNHFDVVMACEDDEGKDLDIPLITVKFR